MLLKNLKIAVMFPGLENEKNSLKYIGIDSMNNASA